MPPYNAKIVTDFCWSACTGTASAAGGILATYKTRLHLKRCMCTQMTGSCSSGCWTNSRTKTTFASCSTASVTSRSAPYYATRPATAKVCSLYFLHPSLLPGGFVIGRVCLLAGLLDLSLVRSFITYEKYKIDFHEIWAQMFSICAKCHR